MRKSIVAKTIVFPTPIFIVGTYDKKGQPNVMAAAWAGICCSQPPCVAVSLRKATYTYGNIVEREAFTVSIPSQDFLKEVDYFGIVSGRDEDKFFRSGLTPERSALVDAPSVKEFPLILECRLLHTLEIGLHTLFVGEIMDVKADDAVLGKGGIPGIEKVRPLVFAPGEQTYYGLGPCLGNAFSLGKTIRNRIDEV